MPTVADLGRSFKEMYPGKYDHLADEEVGRRVKNTDPEQYSQYVDFAIQQNPSGSVSAFDHIFGGMVGNTTPSSSLPDPRTEEHFKALYEYYDPNRGRLTSWWQYGKAEGRNKLLTVLNEEQARLIERGMMLENHARTQQMAKVEFYRFIASNAVLFMQLKLEGHLLEGAINAEMPLDAYKQKRIDDENLRRELERKRMFDELTRQHEREMAEDEIRAAFISEHHKDHIRMEELQRLIDNKLKEIGELCRGTLNGAKIDPYIIPQMISSRRESIEALEADKRGIQQRLSQADSRKDAKGENSKAHSARNKRPGVEEDSDLR